MRNEPAGAPVDTVDARGIDLALLSNPERTIVKDFRQFQICSKIKSGVIDTAVSCAEGEEPLFARQPFIAYLEIDGMPMTLIVNHFKSKRGGGQKRNPGVSLNR